MTSVNCVVSNSFALVRSSSSIVLRFLVVKLLHLISSSLDKDKNGRISESEFGPLVKEASQIDTWSLCACALMIVFPNFFSLCSS